MFNQSYWVHITLLVITGLKGADTHTHIHTHTHTHTHTLRGLDQYLEPRRTSACGQHAPDLKTFFSLCASDSDGI